MRNTTDAPAFSFPSPAERLLALLQVLLLALIAYAAMRFVAYDSLASMADDSVSYLLMGQYFSPWQPASEVLREAARLEQYPPLFPFLLGVTGAAHHLLWAHLLVALCFVASSALLAWWAERELGSKLLATGVLLLFVCLPAVWIRLPGILSENLYLLLSLGGLYLAQRLPSRSPGLYWGVGLLFGAALLTRSLGASLALAYFIQQLFSVQRQPSPLSWGSRMLPAFLPLLLGLAWLWARPAQEGSLYTPYWKNVLEILQQADSPLQALYDLFSPQAIAIYDAWRGALLLYWNEIEDTRAAAVSLLGIFVLLGWLARLLQNRLDAWYVLIYIGIVLFWPFPEQTPRFLYPLLPLLLAYILYFAQALAGGIGSVLGKQAAGALLALMLALTAPSLAFIYERSQHVSAGTDLDYTRTVDFYRLPDAAQAQQSAAWHLLLLADMEKLRKITPPDAKIAWFTPNYLALLAQRQGIGFSAAIDAADFWRILNENAADYIYLSRFHPRLTTFDGLNLLEMARNFGKPVSITRMPDGQTLFSVLLKVDGVK